MAEPGLRHRSAAEELQDLIATRWPDWAKYFRTPSGSVGAPRSSDLYVEIPSPAGSGPTLFVELSPGEVLIRLGERGPERLFAWDEPGERHEAFVEIMNFLEDLRSAEIVAAWQRYRFLWRTWETAHFERAADAADNPRFSHIEGWRKASVRRDS